MKVSFAKGVLTEWYPHATRVEPMANLFDGSLYQAHPDGSIAWDAVTVSPRLGADFARACRICLDCRGRVVVTGGRDGTVGDQLDAGRRVSGGGGGHGG